MNSDLILCVVCSKNALPWLRRAILTQRANLHIVCPGITLRCGIRIFLRSESNGTSFAFIAFVAFESPWPSCCGLTPQFR